MKNVTVYVHGKGGSAKEAKFYRKFFNEDCDIIGFDYKSENRRMPKLSLSIILTLLYRNIIKQY